MKDYKQPKDDVLISTVAGAIMVQPDMIFLAQQLSSSKTELQTHDFCCLLCYSTDHGTDVTSHHFNGHCIYFEPTWSFTSKNLTESWPIVIAQNQHHSFIFTPAFLLERIAEPALLSGLEIPRQSHVVLLVTHQDGTKSGQRPLGRFPLGVGGRTCLTRSFLGHCGHVAEKSSLGWDLFTRRSASTFKTLRTSQVRSTSRSVHIKKCI